MIKTMKNAFKIYKHDMKIIFTNYAALIIFAALCVLPSLYAWINIKASWDPYSKAATSQIKIAVVNNDEGTEFNEKEINIGDKVVESLKENDVLGWQFMSEEDAREALENEEIYASITIPEEFSTDIVSFTTDDINKGEIIYTVNEKINAIAPKITDKGATALQETLSETVVSTVSEVILTLAKDTGVELEEVYLPKLAEACDMLNKIQGKFSDVNSTVNLAGESVDNVESLVTDIQDYIPKVQTLLTKAQVLTSGVEVLMNVTKDAADNMLPSIKEDVKLINQMSQEIDTYADAVIAAIQSGSENAPEMVDNMITKIESDRELVSALLTLFEGLNEDSGRLNTAIASLKALDSNLETAEKTLTDIKPNIKTGESLDLTTLNNIKTVANNVQTSSSNIYDNYDTTIVSGVNGIFEDASSTTSTLTTVLESAESKLPEVENILNNALTLLEKGDEGIAKAQEILPEAEEKINEITEKLQEVNDSEDLLDIINLLKENVQERTDFLSNPVEIVEESLYPMGNYGSAMAPFYSVLAIWVGMTLLVSIFAMHAHGDYREVEVYFGKLMTFGTAAVMQALIIALGDLFLLKIYCSRPLLFVLGMILTGITFLFIIYTLVSVFGNVGKVISIIIMVLQVGGSGGTFPIQLLPTFFQKLNPFLPFTYAISFARQAIGGVVASVLYKDIIVMAFLILISLLLGVLLKKPVNKLLSGFVNKFKESGLGE